MSVKQKLAQLERRHAAADPGRWILVGEGCDCPAGGHWMIMTDPDSMTDGPPELRESDNVVRFTSNICLKAF